MIREPEARPTPDLMRPLLESAIERLIAICDLLDGDPDLEDGGDREMVCEDEGADADRGGLGATSNYSGDCSPMFTLFRGTT